MWFTHKIVQKVYDHLISKDFIISMLILNVRRIYNKLVLDNVLHKNMISHSHIRILSVGNINKNAKFIKCN